VRREWTFLFETSAMSEPDDAIPRADPFQPVWSQVRPLLLSVLLLTILTGVVFPLMLAGVSRALFPKQASGSLVLVNGTVVGSDLIGQDFSGPGYFHPRPSAAGTNGYDASSSSGTNLGPSSHRLLDGDAKGDFPGIRDLADAYRRRNGLAPGSSIPADAVTRSGSGLDPHISPANAALQVERVARARGMSDEVVRRLVAEHTVGRQFGILGKPRVAVLALNLALDRSH
jgi:K+-transporting ATPase ATPase C chain